ncbi:MAG: hypothetical protein P8P74_11160 [Crocinitomicaceae bacterium]|nr:hypothetical protein [Crocinitomicaceae bacterium]
MFVLSVCLISSCSTTEYVGGIQINEASQDDWAKTIKASGMNTAQVTAYAKQGSWNSDTLWWDQNDTTHILNEIRALKAQNVKVIMVLRVALQHNRSENMFKWHGMIYPTTKKQKNEWFYRYGYFIEMWSKLCEREGVDVLAIASEMNALTATTHIDSLPPLLEYFSNEEKQLYREMKIVPFADQLREQNLWEYGQQVNTNIREYLLERIESNIAWTEEAFQTDQPNTISVINQDRKYLDSVWRSIIRNARKYYSGNLTMAANFDNYHEVSFWDELDFIGINAYFSLRPVSSSPLSDESIYQELVQGWEKVFSGISEFKVANNLKNKPIFFTEIGYTKKQDCTLAPWGGEGFTLLSNDEMDTLMIWKEAKEKPSERIMAIDALHEVVKSQKIPLIGLSYWKLTSHAYHEGYEPFMLYINKQEEDGLQSALARFLSRRKRR